MQVSIDAILGSARKISGRRELNEESLGRQKKSEAKTDSISIESRLDSRLDSLETEFKEIQTSLTKNQIILNGIELLKKDIASGGRGADKILDEASFHGRRILSEIVGADFSSEGLNAAEEKTAEKIGADIAVIKRLQVELDNIGASNLAKPARSEEITGKIESYLSGYTGSVEKISSVRADSVMRLTK